MSSTHRFTQCTTSANLTILLAQLRTILILSHWINKLKLDFQRGIQYRLIYFQCSYTFRQVCIKSGSDSWWNWLKTFWKWMPIAECVWVCCWVFWRESLLIPRRPGIWRGVICLVHRGGKGGLCELDQQSSGEGSGLQACHSDGSQQQRPVHRHGRWDRPLVTSTLNAFNFLHFSQVVGSEVG